MAFNGKRYDIQSASNIGSMRPSIRKAYCTKQIPFERFKFQNDLSSVCLFAAQRFKILGLQIIRLACKDTSSLPQTVRWTWQSSTRMIQILRCRSKVVRVQVVGFYTRVFPSSRTPMSFYTSLVATYHLCHLHNQLSILPPAISYLGLDRFACVIILGQKVIPPMIQGWCCDSFDTAKYCPVIVQLISKYWTRRFLSSNACVP